ncbi:MAG: hypothetical protein JXR94_16355, partial [Candidatus Hydrogenedentes bacterium]|nr:hypothetical protein [Candidatus Hydrogenedentota bacterium]
MMGISSKRMALALALGLALFLCIAPAGMAAEEPSLKEAMDGIVTRLYADLDREGLASLHDAGALGLLTDTERAV